MLAQEVIVHTLTGNVTPLTYQSGAAQAMSVTVSGTITGDGNAAVVVTSVELAGGSQTVNVAVDDGVNQVETATVIGTITGDGNADVVVTAAGMTGSPKTINVAVDNGTAQVETTAVIGTITGDGDAEVIVTAAGMTGSPKTVNVAVDDGVNQVETATVAGTIDAAGAGDIDVTVTAAGMTNSPKTIQVAVANNDTASDVAGKIRTALIADADIGHVTTGFFTVTGATDQVILTKKTKAANDATMNIATDTGTAIGLTPSPTSANTTAGAAPDTASVVGGKIRTALIADADIGDAGTGFFTVTGSNENIILTAKANAANDATMNISIDNGTCTGLTAVPTSTSSTPGVAPDNASAVGGKIRTALGADADVTALFGVSGSGANVVLTRSAKVANDATLNISIDNGTCTGLTAAPTSTNTTAGAVPDTAATVAGKIRTALNGVTAITDVFTVGGSSANVTLTRNAADDNDSTMRIQVGNGTCTGLTTTYSTVTTLGVAAGATGIFTRHFVIRSDADNSGTMYIGHSNSNNEYPATLDATNALHILEPGDSVPIHESPLSQSHGEEYILSHWCVDGTASDICRVTYVKRRNSAAAS